MFEIGSSLREARRQRGLELDDAAEATLIRSRYLDALEQERFDLLPEGFYRRSFLRRYADFLGLDSEVVLGEYDHRLAAALQSAQPQPARRAPDALSRRLALVALACLVLAAGVGVAVWLLHGHPRALPATTAALHHAAPPHRRPRPAHHTHAVRRRVPRRIPVLVLRARSGSCWLLVRAGSASGRVLYTGTLEAGGQARFGLRRPLWLRFGAPSHLTATLGGHAVRLPLGSAPGDVRATSAGLRTAP